MTTEGLEWAKVIFGFLAALVWPAAAVAISLIFRSQIQELVKRLKSGEVAGAKFDFQEAASGYIDSKVDQLALETDPLARAEIAGEIKGVAAILGNLHPVSLSILIEAAQGLHAWIGASYSSKKQFFDVLEERGLARVSAKFRPEDDDTSYSIEFTAAGRNLIESIGMIVHDKNWG